MLGYGWKIANIPSKEETTNKGCRRRRKLSPPTYDAICSQNTPRKNSRKESNISMKKYHHRPTLGVKSGSRSRTPYVAARNSQEPVRSAERYKRRARATANPKMWEREKVRGLGVPFDLVTRTS